ncbi:hypothetical protein [Paenibacillus ginsengarvi]|uniref:Uncharacterized protein n=1 Tax=Paenibacillus ginsengarvi TaxID=400777 RepID=A0A3B0AYX7_9BACL|nr:hypothetical protein [Paenibacillus ginsengarvi]RKN65147.1 hypothetical protein D7M11_33220 [Paenibacillus ginsengarvi]
MSEAPIYFEFSDSSAAVMALDTLSELGYHAHATELDGKPGVQVYIDKNDLTSALEIAQASGGMLLSTERAAADADSYKLAYELDSVPIPAHLVNEDWSESYFSGDGAATSEAFDPSGDDYSHFSAR